MRTILFFMAFACIAFSIFVFVAEVFNPSGVDKVREAETNYMEVKLDPASGANDRKIAQLNLELTKADFKNPYKVLSWPLFYMPLITAFWCFAILYGGRRPETPRPDISARNLSRVHRNRR